MSKALKRLVTSLLVVPAVALTGCAADVGLILRNDAFTPPPIPVQTPFTPPARPAAPASHDSQRSASTKHELLSHRAEPSPHSLLRAAIERSSFAEFQRDADDKDNVRAMIVAAVDHDLGLGPRWTPVALRIAAIESSLSCAARNGAARGVFQVVDPARFGVSPSAALTCNGGIQAGLAHMRTCIDKGAHDARQMYACQNTGSPYGRRLSRAYRQLLKQPRHTAELKAAASIVATIAQ